MTFSAVIVCVWVVVLPMLRRLISNAGEVWSIEKGFSAVSGKDKETEKDKKEYLRYISEPVK